MVIPARYTINVPHPTLSYQSIAHAGGVTWCSQLLSLAMVDLADGKVHVRARRKYCVARPHFLPPTMAANHDPEMCYAPYKSYRLTTPVIRNQ